MRADMPSVLFVLGTRPEAVKLAPVIHAARRHGDWHVSVCNTGQHRELLQPFLDVFEIAVDHELDAMVPGQTLGALLGSIVTRLEQVLIAARPDWVVVQGDTTTVLAGALAAFGQGIRVAHVEAGLRTHDRSAPFPEEANRAMVGRIASLHLCPTSRAVENLRREGVVDDVVLTGNTAVDAVRWIRTRLPADGAPPDEVVRQLPRLRADAPVILVTGHRRESFDGGLAVVCGALAELAIRHPEIDVVYPVHLNPRVRVEVDRTLGGLANVHVCAPVGYPAAIWLVQRSAFVVTDSGGIQEEAPELGKPVLVTRVSTERPEAVEMGAAVVVGYDRARLLEHAERWLADPSALAAAVAPYNPFGDGLAAARCVEALRVRLGLPYPLVPPLRGRATP
jgi:UDP-N-acetylglucosamine 2-epimerase (non-hydrolysing)